MSVYKTLNDLLVRNIKKYVEPLPHPGLHHFNMDELLNTIFIGWKCECITTNKFIEICNYQTKLYTLTFMDKLDCHSFNLYINKNNWIIYHYKAFNTDTFKGHIMTIDKILNMCRINMKASPRERIEKILFEVL